MAKRDDLIHAEALAREAGYDLPIAAALEFLVDNYTYFYTILHGEGWGVAAAKLTSIVDWTINGKPEEIE